MEVFLEPVLLLFWTKNPINIRFLKFFVKKKTVSNISKKKKKKYSSKHNGYRFVVNIAQNFVNDYNKNFYLCTRHI